jgi:LuxR family transcriptional regulator, maltose regulon positive regulatory protein
MAAHVANWTLTRGERSARSAAEPILTAKISVPEVPHWAVRRPRITKLIAEGTRRHSLTVVTGPPGAGKTMALALWAAAEPRTVAWVCLDHFDNQPNLFWSYVVAALRRADVAIPKALRVVAHRGLEITSSCYG